jgi:hypothetical protein
MSIGTVVAAPIASSTQPNFFCCRCVSLSARSSPRPAPSAPRVPAMNPISGMRKEIVFSAITSPTTTVHLYTGGRSYCEPTDTVYNQRNVRPNSIIQYHDVAMRQRSTEMRGPAEYRGHRFGADPAERSRGGLFVVGPETSAGRVRNRSGRILPAGRDSTGPRRRRGPVAVVHHCEVTDIGLGRRTRYPSASASH